MILEEPKLSARTRIINGKTYTDWKAYCGRAKNRKYVFFSTDKDKAMDKARDFIQKCRNADSLLCAELNRTQTLDALNAIEILTVNGISLPLSEITTRFVRAGANLPHAKAGVTFEQVLESFMESIDPARERSRRAYATTVKMLLRKIPGGTPAAHVTREQIARALSRHKNPVTYNSELRRVKAIMRRAKSANFVAVSPADGIEPRVEPYREPVFFPPCKVARIMAEVEKSPPPRGAGIYFALGFFAGVRTAEIMRMEWSDVNLEEGYVRVSMPKGVTNGARPRIVELEPCAAAWVDVFRCAGNGIPRTGALVEDARSITDWKKRHLEPLGLSWGNDEYRNVMRHTYATMHVAAFRNPPGTALNMGHGHASGVLERHYMGLAARAEAEAHWRIFPVAR